MYVWIDTHSSTQLCAWMQFKSNLLLYRIKKFYFFFLALLVWPINKLYKTVHNGLKGMLWNELCVFLWLPICSNKKATGSWCLWCETTDALCVRYRRSGGSTDLFVVVKRVLVAVCNLMQGDHFKHSERFSMWGKMRTTNGKVTMWACEMFSRAVELKAIDHLHSQCSPCILV